MRSAITRRTLLVPLAAAAAVSLAACGDDSAGPETGADVEDIANDDFGADPFIGNTVTVSGEVTGIIGRTAFRIGGDDWGGEPLRVVDAAEPDVTEGQVVQITGVVREYEESALEKDYDLTLDEPALDEWGDDHVLVAQKISPLNAG